MNDYSHNTTTDDIIIDLYELAESIFEPDEHSEGTFIGLVRHMNETCCSWKENGHNHTDCLPDDIVDSVAIAVFYGDPVDGCLVGNLHK